MSRTKRRTVLAAIGLALCLASPPAGAVRDALLYGGVHDTAQGTATREVGLELRWPARWRAEQLSWVGGGAATTDEAVWIYAGAHCEFGLGRRTTIAPGFAVSLWDGGDGRDLGGPIEFRSSLELATRVSRRSKLGLLFYHLSNGGFYDANPGSNSLVVSWTFRQPSASD